MREEIALGNLCCSPAGQVQLRPADVIDYIDISSVSNETKSITSYSSMPFSEAPSRARKAIKEKSILVSMVRPNLNAIAVFDKRTHNTPVASTGFSVLDCKENVDHRFVYHYCKSPRFINQMVSQATGASYPAVNDGIIRSALIPNYSFDEQKTISNLLDKTENIIRSRKNELQTLDTLIKARFVEMFGDPVANPKGWAVRPLLEMGSCKNGMNFHYDDSGVEIHCLGVGDFQNHSIISDTTALPMVSLNEMPTDEYLLQDDDVVFVRSNGNKALVGRSVAVYPGNVPTTFSGFCIRYRKQDNSISIPYLLRVLKSESVRTKMAGRGANIQNLNQQILGTIVVPIPPIELQEQFSAFVSQVDKSKVVVQEALNKAHLLFDSLMQQYFG